ncbi:related to epoxide hydrolase [Ramularia collo-cygni]|uniref:Related to epoxide hydrolase n=1 Tax=Ramularia collo-cygni TaxID=112498 RepID=A0A2D3UT97_9PEZI|nr:related to epoxide hydrolase [Ramularia collo-cygni]CZT16010.1 related to epoxide hydrolase [Ramularia collo-cygni]
MDQLEEKHLETSRGFHYRYYVSPAASADASKPAIVLCHGWPDSADLWQFVVPQLLKSKLRLIVPDLLGAGQSSKPINPEAFEIKGMVDDMMEVLKSENITQQIIPMGHDWGSYLAQRLYLLNKDRMAGLITLNVAFQPPRADAFDLETFNAYTEKVVGYPIFAYWLLFADPEGPKLMEQHLESLWYAIHGEDPAQMKNLFCVRGAIKEWVEKDRKDSPLKPYARNEELKNAWIDSKKSGGLVSQGCWYRATAENIHQATESKLDGHVDLPYLFIGADGDAVCRTDAIEGPKSMGLLKNLQVEEVHSGHWSPFEAPDDIARIVLEWLAKNGFSA